MSTKMFGKARFLNTARCGSTSVGKVLLMGLALVALFGPALAWWCHVLIPNFEHWSWLAVGIVAMVNLGLAPAAGLRVAIYVRVSTEDQAKQGFSLDAQITRARQYCEQWGHTVADVYVDDGYSGRKERRPAYQRMLAEHDTWDAILVLKIDRIHRQSRNFMGMIDFLGKNNKQFISVMEHLDTSTPMGRFVMNIIQLIAELESDQIGDRTRIANQERRRQNKCWEKKCKFGYERVDFPAAKKGQTIQNLVPSKDAPLVIEVFKSYAEGLSSSDIGAWLTAKVNGSGETFDWRRIQSMLTYEAYLGIRMAPNTADTHNHEAIVPIELYLKANERLARTNKSVRSDKMPAAWLAARAAAIEAVRKGEEYHVEF